MAGAGNGVPSMQFPFLPSPGSRGREPALGQSSTELQLWVCSVGELQLLTLLI